MRGCGGLGLAMPGRVGGAWPRASASAAQPAASASHRYLGGVMGLIVLFVIVAGGLVVVLAVGVLYGLAHPPRMTLGRALARGLPEHPGELGLDYEAATYRARHGGEETLWLVPGERDDGPLVVVSHGWGDGRYGSQLWLPLVRAYASRVVLYDLRGQGESSAATSRCGLDEPDDLLHLLDHLGAERVVLLGYSLGACVSVVAAAKDAEAADAGATRGVRGTSPRGLGRGRIVGVIGDGIYRRWDEPIVSLFRMRRWPRQPMLWLAGAWMWVTHREFRRFDRAAWAAKLRCPLLLLHGDDDAICPLASAQAVAAAAPDARLVTFEGGGHLDLVERDPDRYRDALDAFFSLVQERTPQRHEEHGGHGAES